MRSSETVDEVLDALLAGVRERFGECLTGVYLRGSLATGDFDPETSDIDVLAVTERPVTDEEFDALSALHEELDVLPNPYAGRVEIAYIDRAALRRYQHGVRHPDLGQGEKLAWNEHGSNWLLERWIVREHGIVLTGPDPRTLIDPISAHELREAVLERLVDWADWALDVDDPEWKLHRGHKAYVVETMCRTLYTLNHGALSSKREAVEWARLALPEPWRSTVVRSQTWRNDSTVDLSIVPEVRAFVLWASFAPKIC